jgi:hypothetical protein
MERVAMLFAGAIMFGSLACRFRYLTFNVMLGPKAFAMPTGEIGSQLICGYASFPFCSSASAISQEAKALAS